MEYESITVTAADFDIRQTLECGQCFRYEKMADYHYRVTAMGKVVYIRQRGADIEVYPATDAEFREIWSPYFDLGRDYSAIKSALSENCGVMRAAAAFAPGLRILNQDIWETLVSFIISQHNAIPNIARVVNTLSERYGTPVADKTAHKIHYSFPGPEALLRAGIDGLTACKAGFRARYIIDACESVLSGKVSIDKNTASSTDELREMLMQIKGVGGKVADCVLVFGYRRTDCFPTDIWVKRAAEKFYFGGNPTDIKEIHRFAAEKFGENAAYASQYLFHYIRSIPC